VGLESIKTPQVSQRFILIETRGVSYTNIYFQ